MYVIAAQYLLMRAQCRMGLYMSSLHMEEVLYTGHQGAPRIPPRGASAERQSCTFAAAMTYDIPNMIESSYVYCRICTPAYIMSRDNTAAVPGEERSDIRSAFLQFGKRTCARCSVC